MPQAVNSNLFLHVDNSCLMFQRKDVEEIDKVLIYGFENIYDWFADNKLNIHSVKIKANRFLCKIM